MELKRIFEAKIAEHKKFLTKLIEKHGNDVLGEMTLAHLFRGIRGLPVCYTPTSHVDPERGVLYRGKTLWELKDLLPKPNKASVPTIEAVLWYLLTGDTPTATQVDTLQKDLNVRAYVPHHVFNAIDALPKKSRPMTRFCIGITAWTTASSFQDSYDKAELTKADYWSLAFDDVLNLIAGAPQIASYIYRTHCKEVDTIDPNPKLDWAANFTYMMGYKTMDTQDLIRLFMLTHADHSASNVSAHTAHTVGSALANAYYTTAASMLGLAGPLHGHANEQTILWLLEMIKLAEAKGLEEPTPEFIEYYVKDTLQKGRVIPGYGHAALRVEDPRFTMFYDRCKSRGFNTPLLRAVDNIYKITPAILGNMEKIANPNPNMDAITGACLYSEGIVEHNFYTVLFGMARLIGILTQHIIDRSIGQPIFRPKTMSFDMLETQYKKKS